MKKISMLLLLAVIITSSLLFLSSCKKETVDFMIGDEVYHTSKIKNEAIADMPKDPSRDDMYFLGWFTDAGIWDGAAADGLKIYASWLSLTKGEDGTYTVSGISERHPGIINIPSEHMGCTVTAINEKAFSSNAEITEVNIPSSVSRIGEAAFSDCTKLTAINVDEKNEAYKTENGDLYNKDGTAILQYAIGKSDAEIELSDELTSIAPYAFSRARSITSVTIPCGVVSISDYAFYGCTSLNTVTISADSEMTAIGASSFSNCSLLSEITIPKSVKSIGEWAFYGCTSLKKVSFERKSAIETVDEFAFAMTPKLEVIYYDGSLRKWNDRVEFNKDANEISHLIRDYDSAGSYLVPEGAWVPNDEYAGITYGAWANEEDYLSGLAPTKWYTSEELLTEHIGTMDTNGKEYSDPEFIPGYVHLYADVSNTKMQLVTGHDQKLKLNLGGYTLTLSKGIRVGGNDASHPEALLSIMYGTVNFTAGQIQPRRDSTFIIESTVFVCNLKSGDLFYGACSDLIHFKNSELIVTGGSTFMLTYNTNAGEPRSKILFERTDISYVDTPAKASMFRIIQGRGGITAWDIIIDSESTLSGEIDSLVTLQDTFHNGLLYRIDNQHSLTLEEGVLIQTNVEEYNTYLMVTYSSETGEAMPAQVCPEGDLRLDIIQ